MNKGILVLATVFSITSTNAQFSDNFNDGNFTANPTWQGAPADFIINASGQLQSANNTASSTFLITTAHTTVQQTAWEFWVKFDFNPSSVNYTDVWLASIMQDVSNMANGGYFVRIGSADDDICLYKKEAGNAPQKIIDGTDGLLNASANAMKIKVICTIDKKWILLRDMRGTGDTWRSEGEWADNQLTGSNFFGIQIRQSTASFFGRHFFDDFVVGPFAAITTPPAILSAIAPTSNSVKITFDRPLNSASAENVLHYFISGRGNPLAAAVDAHKGNVVHLEFENPFTANEKNTLLINDVADVFGNKISNVFADFSFYKPARYDVVIDEIFADPSPQAGLPLQKFIEIKNNAPFPVSLKNWRLTDGNSNAYLPDIEILPDSFLIVTTMSGLDAYKAMGNSISISNFPSLNISGGEVALYDERGSLMHAMKYDLNAYQNELKKEGGFSLEMINTKAGCAIQKNWTASNHPAGGTPGKKNSVDADIRFAENIEVKNAYLSSPDTIYLLINKTADSIAAAKKENYILDGGLVVSSVEILPPFFDVIRIGLQNAVAADKIYSVKVNALSGCTGSSISTIKNTASFAVPRDATPNDMVINEILFDPRPQGVDYLELYNKSEHAIDLKSIFIANRNATGAPANFVQASSAIKLIFPGKFALLTTDPDITASHFPSADTDAFIKISSLPSFPDDSGTAIVMNQQGILIDEINYSKYWHFSLIKDREGISLERIKYSGPSNASNFHSASTTLSGTPGYKNSQSTPDDAQGGGFSLSHKIFSPDNDGTDDFLLIHYEFATPGFVSNIKIFDASGRMVRYLEKNSLSSMKGYYRWDGLDDKSSKLPQGIYIIYFESFNEAGKKVIHKKSVVLARRW